MAEHPKLQIEPGGLPFYADVFPTSSVRSIFLAMLSGRFASIILDGLENSMDHLLTFCKFPAFGIHLLAIETEALSGCL